ncbi:ATP-binding protein [Clostridium niameyense]|uniref:ATP-binding protein n=1 Tax=Clostridium niameyense TaxID=1622073 RepID=A0A6M0R8W4_9CLOT|nr:ATP-binding protein [Clostridium niameyense]NEZ46130.1 ATP-binding protein [Clostridium niameyense]
MAKNLEMKELEFKLETCPKCGKPINKKIKILNKTMIVPVICDCIKREIEENEEIQLNKEKQIRLKQIINNSLMDEKFKNSRFDNWDFSKGTKRMYDIGNKYIKGFKDMKKESIGLLIYGEPGNGKTHTVACIANELISRMVPVICVSINALLDRIKDTYNRFGNEGENTVLKSLVNADLLIIDDLGTEQNTDWSRTRIYNILDSRYRNELPLIITTNLPLNDLQGRYEKRTYDRLLEMCTPVFNDGPSIRVEKAKEKTRILKELLD